MQKDTVIGITLDKANFAIFISDEYKTQKFYQYLGRIVHTDFENFSEKFFKKVNWLIYENCNSVNILENKNNQLND